MRSPSNKKLWTAFWSQRLQVGHLPSDQLYDRQSRAAEFRTHLPIPGTGEAEARHSPAGTGHHGLAGGAQHLHSLGDSVGCSELPAWRSGREALPVLSPCTQWDPRSLATSCRRRNRAVWFSWQILLAGASLSSSKRMPLFFVGVSPVLIMLLISFSLWGEVERKNSHYWGNKKKQCFC